MAKANKNKTPAVEEVTLYSYPPIVFFWPVIASGPILWFLMSVYPAPTVYGVIWWISLIIPISTMGIDVSRDNTVKIVFFAATIVLGGVVLAYNGVPFGWIGTIILSKLPSFDVGTAVWTSILGGILLMISIVLSRFESRWVINPNQFQHTCWLSVDRSIAHGTKTVIVEYPDMQEFILLFAGDIVIKSADGSREIARITNIPFLPWIWPQIRELVEEVRVRKITPALEDDEAEADDAEV